MADLRKCPNCGFENHASCRFCIQCGMGLEEAAEGAGQQTREEPEPHESPEMPAEATEALLERIVSESEFEHKRTNAGWRIEVPLGEERRQKVYVMFNGHDDHGNDIVSFLSVCGPVREGQVMRLLRLNAKQPYGAFGVKTIQGKDYFVVTANQLARTADPEEVQGFLLEVAKRADALEEQLSRGQDVF